MPFVYGSLPVGFSALKALTLTHPDFTSGTPGTVTISTSADFYSFEAAVALLNTALRSATSNDLNLSWNYEDSGVCYLYSEGDKEWFITDWKARGFFGYEFPISSYYPSGTSPSGATYFDGLFFESVDIATTSETREDPGDGYAFIKGKTLNITGFVKVGNLRYSKNTAKGAGSSVDWSAYKGVITCQPGADSGAYSLTNLDGKLTDAELLGISLSGREALMGEEVWTIGMVVQIE